MALTPLTRRATLATAAALAAAIFVLREALANPDEGVTNLYAVPIAIVAVRFGVRGGVLAAFVSLMLFAVWEVAHADVTTSVVGYVTRATAFLVLGGLVGKFAADREALVRRLTALARTDPLTGLANRTQFDLALADALEAAQRHGRSGAVLIADLDGFKAINDSFGHALGDEVLKDVAGALTSTVRRNDTVARVGGDEFAVLLPDTTERGAETAARRLGEAVRAVGRGRGAVLDLSVGMAAFTGDGLVGAAELLTAADREMYAEKRRRKPAVVRSAPAIDRRHRPSAGTRRPPSGNPNHAPLSAEAA